MEKKEQKSFQALVLTVGKLSAMVLAFVVPMFLARFLTKDEYGYYSQFNTAVSFMMMIFGFGISTNLYYFFPRMHSEEHAVVIGNTVKVLFVGGLLGCIFLAIPFCGKLIIGSGQLRSYLPYFFIYILCFMPTQVLEPLYIVANDHWTSILYPPGAILLKLLCVLIFGVWQGGLSGVLLGVVVSVGMTFIFAMCYYGRFFKKCQRSLHPIQLLKEQVRYVFPFGCAVILNTFARQFDKIVCISFLSVADYAVYAVAFFGIPGIKQISSSFGNVYLTNLSKAFSCKDMPLALQIQRELLTKLIAFSFPIILIVSLYASRIITLFFTEKYVGATPFFRIYILSFLFIAIGGDLVIRASGQTSKALKAYAYAAIITIPGTWLAVRYFGAWGGITLAMLGQFFPNVILMIYGKQIVNCTIREYLPLKSYAHIFVQAMACFIPFLFLHIFFPLNVFFCGILACLYLSCVYLIQLRCGLFLLEFAVINKLLVKVGLGKIGAIYFSKEQSYDLE